jgi:hypothetical protein
LFSFAQHVLAPIDNALKKINMEMRDLTAVLFIGGS